MSSSTLDKFLSGLEGRADLAHKHMTLQAPLDDINLLCEMVRVQSEALALLADRLVGCNCMDTPNLAKEAQAKITELLNSRAPGPGDE